jgi:hypothetical protein
VIYIYPFITICYLFFSYKFIGFLQAIHIFFFWKTDGRRNDNLRSVKELSTEEYKIKR